jgi:penicillin-binding protein 1A
VRADSNQTRVEIVNRKDGGVLFWLGRLYGFSTLVVLALISLLVTCEVDDVAESTPWPEDFGRYASVAPTVSRLVAADGTAIGSFAEEWREIAAYDDIPEQLINAFLAAEDHRFFEHRGIDRRGILRAAWRNLSAGDFAQGGSTITQQVAKQYLGNEKSISRKLKEAILALRIEDRYSKKAILAIYLNHIFLGSGAYGVKAAALRYFSKPLAELELGEMAMLAGLAQAPSRYSPLADYDAAIARRDEVLERMARYGFATDDEVAAARKQRLALEPRREPFGNTMPYAAEHARRRVESTHGADALRGGGLQIELAAEPVVEALAYENVDFGSRKQDKRQGWRGPVAHLQEPDLSTFRKRAAELYGDGPLIEGKRYLAVVEEVTPGEATVRVGAITYDLPLVNARWAYRWKARDPVNDRTIGSLDRALEEGDIVWVAREAPVSGPFTDYTAHGGATPNWIPVPSEARLARLSEEATGRVVLEQSPHPQVAILTVDHRTGYVVAMVGGNDAERSSFNRALQACRQPGSTYKPIYYSAALDEGYGFDTSLNDIPRKEAEVDEETGEVWIPENLGGTVNITVSMEYAMVYSKNVPSVSIFRRVGAENVEKWARRLGFTTPIIADRALALGASCTKLDELTAAFAIFARNGRRVPFHHIRRIVDRDGNAVEDNTAALDPMLAPANRLDRVVATAGVEPEQVISPRTAFLTSKLLRQAIKSGFASIVRKTGVIAAGKTGTSSATMDTSFVGYTSRWITSVWMGDDLRERPLGVDDAAYITVVPLWARYMFEATADQPLAEIPWAVPEGVDPDDRGDHSKGGIKRMSLKYLHGHTQSGDET